MCFGGGAPKTPKIVQSGPSPEQLAAQQQSLNDYTQQVQQQQDAFAKQLQQQIALAEKETAAIQAKYDQELEDAAEAANAAGAAEANNVYAVTATQTPATGAETTTSIAKKKKNKTSLKIASGATTNQAGSGLNIGV